MEKDTHDAVQTLRCSLAVCLTSLKAEKQKVFHLSVAMSSLLDNLKRREPKVYEEVETVRKSVESGGIEPHHFQAYFRDQRALDATIEALETLRE